MGLGVGPGDPAGELRGDGLARARLVGLALLGAALGVDGAMLGLRTTAAAPMALTAGAAAKVAVAATA